MEIGQTRLRTVLSKPTQVTAGPAKRTAELCEVPFIRVRRQSAEVQDLGGVGFDPSPAKSAKMQFVSLSLPTHNFPTGCCLHMPLPEDAVHLSTRHHKHHHASCQVRSVQQWRACHGKAQGTDLFA